MMLHCLSIQGAQLYHLLLIKDISEIYFLSMYRKIKGEDRISNFLVLFECGYVKIVRK